MAMAAENKTNLIINYLPQTLSDEDFTALFTAIGLIKSAKIIRDKASGYSYGFGFVDYQNPEDADRAIQTLNGYRMQNKTIKVAFARPSGEEIKHANLYVKGLPKTMSGDSLNALFCSFGTVVQTRILTDPSGASKGIGFVLFDKHSEATTALNTMNGQFAPGGAEPLNIKFAEENHGKNRGALNQARGTKRGGFRGGRGRGAGAGAGGYGASTWEDYGGGYGNGVDTWGSGGYGYDSYGYSGGYGSGYGSSYGGRGGGPMRSQGNRARFNPMNTYQGGSSTGGGGGSADSGNVLFVYNIGTDAAENTLWQLFSPFGNVQKVNVIKDHTKNNQCKGYGFVTMSSYDEALSAIQNLNGYNFTGVKPLQVSFKTSK